MKKSTRQQLQSRISLRRNTIRHIESEIQTAKGIARLVKRMGANGVNVDLQPHYAHIRALKDEVSFLALDQRLDKDMYIMLLQREANDRWFTESFDYLDDC